MPLKYSSIDAPKAHCTWADSHICFTSAFRYAHSIKKHRIIKFPGERGQLIRPDTFTKRLRKIYAAIGFPREYHLHTLRHYFVSSLLHCGVDKQTVADLVGHADTGFLERTYCHPQQAQKEQAADSMLTMLRPDGEQIFNLAAACSPKRHSA